MSNVCVCFNIFIFFFRFLFLSTFYCVTYLNGKIKSLGLLNVTTSGRTTTSEQASERRTRRRRREQRERIIIAIAYVITIAYSHDNTYLIRIIIQLATTPNGEKEKYMLWHSDCINAFGNIFYGCYFLFHSMINLKLLLWMRCKWMWMNEWMKASISYFSFIFFSKHWITKTSHIHFISFQWHFIYFFVLIYIYILHSVYHLIFRTWLSCNWNQPELRSFCVNILPNVHNDNRRAHQQPNWKRSQTIFRERLNFKWHPIPAIENGKWKGFIRASSSFFSNYPFHCEVNLNTLEHFLIYFFFFFVGQKKKNLKPNSFSESKLKWFSLIQSVEFRKWKWFLLFFYYFVIVDAD